jgi:hypothetical protein
MVRRCGAPLLALLMALLQPVSPQTVVNDTVAVTGARHRPP